MAQKSRTQEIISFFFTYKNCAKQENLASGDMSASRHGKREFGFVESPGIFRDAEELAQTLKKRLALLARSVKLVNIDGLSDEEAIEQTWLYMIDHADEIAALIAA